MMSECTVYLYRHVVLKRPCFSAVMAFSKHGIVRV